MSEINSIVFLHIPKAGGMTLHRIIERQYDHGEIYTLDPSGDFVGQMEGFKLLPQERRMKFKMLKGHMLFRARLDEYMPQPSAYITLLRDPIERIISYYYILDNPHHYLNEVLISRRLELKEFVESGMPTELNNFQTDLLSTVDPVLLKKYGPKNYPWDILLESAKSNLLQHFLVVGVLERFDEFLVLLKRSLGWQIHPYSRQNVTSNRPSREAISEDTIAVIKACCRYDMELYRFACGRMDELVAQQDGTFPEEVKRFSALDSGILTTHCRSGKAP